MTNTSDMRNPTIDLAKGILIIIVVIGHSGSFLTKYIFWFHMPAFFLISGLLLRKIENKITIKKYLLKKYNNYGIIYISYFVLLITMSLLYTNLSEFSLYKIVLKLIIGGRFVGRELGVFWYLSCLVFSLTIFFLIQIFIKQKIYQPIVYISLYLLAHIEAYFQLHSNITLYIPLNMDVALLAVCYIAIGFYFKEWILKILNDFRLNMQLMVSSFIICFILILLDINGTINYRLDMKSVIYNNLLGDIPIPIIFTFFILSLSAFLNQKSIFKFLLYFGKYSIAIMFMHFTILEIYRHYFIYNWIIFSLLGCIIPLFFAIIFDKYKITRTLFLTGK